MTARELEQMLSSRQLPPFPRERLKRVEAAVIADLKPVRPLAPDGAYLAGLAAIFVAVCAMGAYFAGPEGWQALSELRKIAVFLPLAAATALLVFSLVRQMQPAAKHARSSALLSAAFFILLLLLIAIFFQAVQESAFVRSGLLCFRTGMKFAIPAAFLFALLLHRGAALSPALAGATAGGLAGLAGWTVLEIHCPNLNVYHIIVWHVAVTLACVAAGLVFSSVTFRRWTSNH